MAYIISSDETSGIILENDTMTVPGGVPNLADDVLTVTNNTSNTILRDGDVLLANAMPQAEYMYGCTPTAVGMILGYYDLYGYRGADFSALIDGDVDLKSRGTDGNAYNMDAFDTVLGRAIATEDYVYRFFSRGDIDVITGKKAGSYWTTSGEEELEYSFVNGGEGPELRTDVWNCIADYLGTGQVWRGADNLSTTISQDITLEEVLNYNMNITYIAGDIQRTVDWRYTNMLYGLYLYVESKGYSLDREITRTRTVDAAGGDFTFEDYKAEIDAGRPVLISLEGHSMVGYGYNAETKEIIFDDCYQADQRMVWGETYHYSEMDLPLQSITVIGLMADIGVDLAVSPVTADSGELFFAADSVPFASGDYCYPGSAVTVNFTVSNLGASSSGAFAVSVYVDGILSTSIDILSLEGNASANHTDIPLGSLAPGLHTVRVVADEANVIQELSGGNNVLEQKLMVLKDGANVVTGIRQVGSGQVSPDDYVASGWQMHVLDGGTASGTVVRGIVTDVAPNGMISFLPAIVTVSQGGLVQDAAVYEYGQLQLGGTAEDIHVFEKGSIEVFSVGMLTGKLTVENGAAVSMNEEAILNFDLTRTTAGADALVNDLSVIRGTPLYTLTVDGTQANGTYSLAEGAADFAGTISVVNTSGESLGTLTVGATATIDGKDYALVLSDSTLSVSVVKPVVIISGLVLTDETRTVNPDEMYQETTLNSGGILTVGSDGAADGTTVNSGGEFYVAFGGTANNVTVNPGGYLSVEDGGTAAGIVENGGYVEYYGEETNLDFLPNTINGLLLEKASATVHSGTTANSVTVNSRGRLEVFSGGTATGTTVSGGALVVSGDGVADSTTVNSGGYLYVDFGGTANNVTVNPGGYLSVEDGATASGIVENGGYVWYYGEEANLEFLPNTINGLLLEKASATVHSGTTANSVTVNSRGKLCIYEGGSAMAIKENGGYVSVADGADVSFAANRLNGMILSGSSASATVHSGTTANSTLINSGGRLEVFSGGTADNTTVSCGGIGRYSTLYGSTALEIVLDGGTANNTVLQGVDAGLIVSRGGVANSTTVAGYACGMSVLGSANDIDLKWGSVDVSSGGSANNITVNANTGLYVYSGGTAEGIVENGGFVDDFLLGRKGGSTTFVSNTFSGLKLGDNMWATVHSGTTACDTTVGYMGWLCILSGGIANDTVVQSAYARNGKAGNSCGVHISSGGTANGITVQSSGYVYVSSGGTAVDATVLSGGTMVISSGFVNNLKIADGASLSVNRGAITGRVLLRGAVSVVGTWFSYDLTKTSAGEIALLNDYSLAGGGCTVIVADDQAHGIYSLADGADDFEGNFYIQDATGKDLAKRRITLGETVEIGAKDQTTPYTFFLSCGDLFLAVGCDVPDFIVSSEIEVTDQVIVNSGEIYDSATVSGDGHITVSSGGTATRTTAGDGGTIVVSGGTAKRIQVETNGSLFVADGIALNTVGNGGEIVVSGGGSAYNTLCYGGTVMVSGGGVADDSVVSGGNLQLAAGGTANDAIVYLGEMLIEDGGVANRAMVFNEGRMRISGGGVADDSVVSGGKLFIFSGGTADNTFLDSRGSMSISGGAAANRTDVMGSMILRGDDVAKGSATATTIYGAGRMAILQNGVADDITVHGVLTVSSGGTATAVKEDGGYVTIEDGAEVTFASHTFSGRAFYGGSATVHSGTTAVGIVVFSSCRFDVYNGGIVEKSLLGVGSSRGYEGGVLAINSGGTATDTNINGRGSLFVSEGGSADSTNVNSGGFMYIFDGAGADHIVVNEGGRVFVQGGTADNIIVNSRGNCSISAGKITGKMTFESGAAVSAEEGGIIDFDLTGTSAGAEALVNDLSIIQGTPLYTLTVDGTQANGDYKLADGAADFAGTISVVNTAGESLGALTVGATTTIDGTDYLLANENGALSVTVSGNADTPAKKKWTYIMYMAADSNLCRQALYDIVLMQQAVIDLDIEICVLVDRCPTDLDDGGDAVTVNGTYKWDSEWSDTRVGRITHSPGMTVTVDWESWGELNTGSIDTLKRFVNWAQETSPADNYALVLWDHGGENGTLCVDLTTDPNWGAVFSVSEVADFLKEKENIPLVFFSTCLLGSEIVATQMTGRTEVIVASEPPSYMSTYSLNYFFNTITAEMTPQEMAQIMVRNVESNHADDGSFFTMLSSIDVRDSRLGDALEAFAEAVAAAGNDADKAVLINALLQAPQDGCLYDGSIVQQSDLGFLIRDAMADSGYESTSEEFKKALADVKAALDAVVLEYRSVPANRGSGIAFCNTVCTAQIYVGTGRSAEKVGSGIKSYITTYYKSNPLWGGLLYDLCAKYLEQEADRLIPPATFDVSSVDGLAEGMTVAVSDLGCFSGLGAQFNGIHVIGESFFSFLITAEDKSTGSITVSSDIGAEVMVTLLTSNGSVIASDTGSVSFENLPAGDYYLRLQSETNSDFKISFSADWWTGVDRFDYAGSGKNEKNANGNGSIETATQLDDGYYSGLLTYKGDTDYYRIGNIYSEQYRIELNGQEEWTVAEYDGHGELVRTADFSNGKFTLTMASMNYLLVEGTADLEKESDPYSLSVIGITNGSTDVVTLDNLSGSKDEVSWTPSAIANQYSMELSADGFGSIIEFNTAGTAVDLLGLPAGTYQWRVRVNTEEDNEWYVGEEIVSDNANDAPQLLQSQADASDDLFFATPNGTWGSRYCAQHVGSVGDWTGTGELVSAAGKGRIQDLFFGSADPGTLFLTDSENGDALFLDDVYTGLPEEIKENTARLFRLRHIEAGAGDDIIDLTSQRFAYTGNAPFIHGGDGDDVIWACYGNNELFGDAGNDRIVGASGNDVIVGGIGNDTMHGGGGDDIFTFCENWGTDTVQQLESGTVTLWFVSGDESNWNAETLTYADGSNSVTVSGVAAERITLKFGEDEDGVFGSLYEEYAFEEFSTQRIFQAAGQSENGILASV